MSLTDILTEVSAQSAKRIPPEARAIMQQASADYAAHGVGANALKVGDTLPDAAFTNARGERVNLSSLLSGGPVILNFYRGGWCPYCNFELKAYQELLPDIKALGATLVAVTPEKPDNSLTTMEKNALSFPVLTDEGNAFAKALGLVFELTGNMKALYEGFGLNLAEMNAASGWTLAIPAVYVAGADGRILFADVDLDYRRRAEPGDVLAALKETVA